MADVGWVFWKLNHKDTTLTRIPGKPGRGLRGREAEGEKNWCIERLCGGFAGVIHRRILASAPPDDCLPTQMPCQSHEMCGEQRPYMFAFQFTRFCLEITSLDKKEQR